MRESVRNWAGNHVFRAERWHHPESVDEARAIVRQTEKVKAAGTLHAFNGIADTDGAVLSTSRLTRIFGIDKERGTVTAEAGIRYADLATFLHGEGFALGNLASLPHISIGGAVSTATHGSGDGNGNLSTQVVALEMITADGGVRQFDRRDDVDLFPGLVVGLGRLGVLTKLTLAVEPTYDVGQTVYEDIPLERVLAEFDAVMSSAYSVSLFSTWATASVDQVWLKSRAGEAKPQAACIAAATPASRALHPIRQVSAESCTVQLGEIGPWHERLSHFRPQFTPSKGDELQSEFFVPRENAVAALRAVADLGDEIAPLLQISEVRSVAADDLWLSPCFNQDSIAIHFTWNPDWAKVKALLPKLEKSLARFAARPHWAKLYTADEAAIAALYPKWPAFDRLVKDFDPSGKFAGALPLRA